MLPNPYWFKVENENGSFLFATWNGAYEVFKKSVGSAKLFSCKDGVCVLQLETTVSSEFSKEDFQKALVKVICCRYYFLSDVAKECGVPGDTVIDWMIGKKTPPPETRDRLTKEFRQTLGYK